MQPSYLRALRAVKGFDASQGARVTGPSAKAYDLLCGLPLACEAVSLYKKMNIHSG